MWLLQTRQALLTYHFTYMRFRNLLKLVGVSCQIPAKQQTKFIFFHFLLCLCEVVLPSGSADGLE